MICNSEKNDQGDGLGTILPNLYGDGLGHIELTADLSLDWDIVNHGGRGKTVSLKKADFQIQDFSISVSNSWFSWVYMRMDTRDLPAIGR